MEKESLARMPGESALAYEYFKLYCEMLAAERSLQALCDRVVTGKKRSEAVFKRWSSQHDWQVRVACYDTAVESAAATELFARRQAEISDFIDKDLQASLEFQRLCLARLQKLSSDGDAVDSKELRQLAMAYKESREWLKELIGLVDLQNEMAAKDETAA